RVSGGATSASRAGSRAAPKSTAGGMPRARALGARARGPGVRCPGKKNRQGARGAKGPTGGRGTGGGARGGVGGENGGGGGWWWDASPGKRWLPLAAQRRSFYSFP